MRDVLSVSNVKNNKKTGSLVEFLDNWGRLILRHIITYKYK